MPNQFTEQLIKDLLEEYWDDQSFGTVITEVVKRTVRECAFQVGDYCTHRLPASEYAWLLRKHFGLPETHN